MKKSSLATALVCATLVVACKPIKTKPVNPDANLSEKFGFGALKMDKHDAVGERPLFVGIVINPTTNNSFGAGANADGSPNVSYYDKLIFGTGDLSEKSLVNYFRQQSYGNFTFKRVGKGVWGPYTYLASSIPDQGAYMILEAAKEGLDFSIFDVNHDGTVDKGELHVLTIDNGSTTGGATRSGSCVYPTNSKGVRVCNLTAAAGGMASFTTIVHEVSHTLGTFDLYGSNCHGEFLTLMSCTIFPYDNWMNSWNLDPWHKMVLGWIEPRTFDLPLYSPTAQIINTAFSATNAKIFKRNETLKSPTISQKTSALIMSDLNVDVVNSQGTGGCANLEAPQFYGGTPTTQQSPVLLYSSAIGVNNFLMLEFRNPWAAHRGEFNSDANTVSPGVAIWEIQTTGPARPAVLSGVDINNPQNTDPGVLNFSADTGIRGGNKLWTSRNGEFSVKWINGLDIGLKMRVAPISSYAQTTVDVEWGMGSMPSADIKGVYTDSNSKGSYLGGMLGIEARGRKINILSATGDSWEVAVQSWGCEKVYFTMPSNLPTGTYTAAILSSDGVTYESAVEFQKN